VQPGSSAGTISTTKAPCSPDTLRPTNENTNGLLRNYFPRGSDFAAVTKADLDRAAHELNTRPRRTLDWLTPAAKFAQLCAFIP
jgi:IS30 family transposase